MDKITTAEFDVKTQELKIRELNNDELKQYENDKLAFENNLTQIETILTKLGISKEDLLNLLSNK